MTSFPATFAFIHLADARFNVASAEGSLHFNNFILTVGKFITDGGTGNDEDAEFIVDFGKIIVDDAIFNDDFGTVGHPFA